MKIIEAVTQIDKLMPGNGYSQYDKIRWLSDLDSVIKTQIIDTHEGAENVVFTPYDENTPQDTELLVSAPFERIYILWLEAQINYHDAEFGKYNNSIISYNNVYSAFVNHYNRTHMPIQHKIKFF